MSTTPLAQLMEANITNGTRLSELGLELLTTKHPERADIYRKMADTIGRNIVDTYTAAGRALERGSWFATHHPSRNP